VFSTATWKCYEAGDCLRKALLCLRKALSCLSTACASQESSVVRAWRGP
jgi:hypothetical protein